MLSMNQAKSILKFVKTKEDLTGLKIAIGNSYGYYPEYKGITIDDLKLFEQAFNNIDERHTYEKIIYDAYIENNAFVLTDEQREKAYKAYKTTRK